MTLNEYQEKAARTISAKTTEAMENHALHGMSAEIGELHGIYQKRHQGHVDIDRHRMTEIGDVLWMIAEYCTSQGWSLETVAEVNIDKLKSRYPDGFESERSIHRKPGDI